VDAALGISQPRELRHVVGKGRELLGVLLQLQLCLQLVGAVLADLDVTLQIALRVEAGGQHPVRPERLAIFSRVSFAKLMSYFWHGAGRKNIASATG